MNKVLEYMIRKHEHLQYNYSPEFGKNPEDCSEIALQIAQLLLEEGKLARIVRFSREDRKLIRPIIFERQIGLWYHDVCVCKDNAYEPVLKNPVPFEEYCKRFFGEEIPFKIITDERSIESIVRHSIVKQSFG